MSEKQKKKQADSSSRCEICSCTEFPISSLNSEDESAGRSCPTKSEGSMYMPLNFSDELEGSRESVAEFTGPSCVSIKSDRSKMYSLLFGDEKSKRSQSNASGFAAPSEMSLKTERSTSEPLGCEAETRRPVTEKPSTCALCKDVMRDPVQLIREHCSCKPCLSSDLNQSDSPADYSCPQCGKKYWKILKQERDTRGIPLLKVKAKLKEAMKHKFSSITEGNGDVPSSLNSVYTELHMNHV